MKSRTTAQFRHAFMQLPKSVQQSARYAYRQFQRDTWYTGLRFKQVHPNLPIYSVRIGKNYRAVGQRDKTGMVWFWIGSHAEYDKLLSRMI